MTIAVVLCHARRLGGLLLVTGAVAAGCAKAQPETVPDGPPLAMPLPPARIFAPLEVPLEAAPAIPPEDVPVTAEAPRATPRPPARRPAAAAQETRTEPEPAPPAAVTAPPAAPDPSRELRPTTSVADAAAERQVRELLQRAARDLSRVDYRRLSNDGRSQYEQSKRFSDQAEEALKERNFVFAATLADKAATLAAQLGG